VRRALAGGGALLLTALVLAPLLREDEAVSPVASRRATATPLRVAIERPRLAPPIPMPMEAPPVVIAPVEGEAVIVPVDRERASVVDVAPPSPAVSAAHAPTLEARAQRAERRLAALERREAVARRIDRARRELALGEDAPEAESLRILLGDDSPFRR
jgi:hypothetical protein